MEKQKLDFNNFLHELDSREELKQFNVSEYTNKYEIEDKDAQNFTYEYISFNSIDFLEQLLIKLKDDSKKEDYKNYLLNRVATTRSNINKAQYLTILAKCFKTQVDEAFNSLKNAFIEFLRKDKESYTTHILFNNLTAIAFLNKKNREHLYQFLSDTIIRKDIPNERLVLLCNMLSSSHKFQYQFTLVSTKKS